MGYLFERGFKLFLTLRRILPHIPSPYSVSNLCAQSFKTNAAGFVMLLYHID